MLYSQEERTFTGTRTRDISAAEFQRISAWPIVTLMRSYLNDWGAFFENDPEFIKMLNSKNDKQHYSAIFELLIGTALIKSGFLLEKHPQVDSLKKPDFKAIHPEIHELFLECTLSGNSFENLDEKNKKETIEDIIEGIEYYPFFINVNFKSLSDISISKKRLLHFFQEIKNTIDTIPMEILPTIKYPYQDNGWDLEFSFIKKPNGNVKRSLGMLIGAAKTINTEKPILGALKDKRPSKYAISTSPYIICLSTNDLFTSEHSFSEALFGQYGIDINISDNSNNSLFIANGKPSNTSISAVLIARNFDLFTLSNSNISIWHNPFAANPIKKGILPFVEYVYIQKDNCLKRQSLLKTVDIFTLLQIDRREYETLVARQSIG